MAVIGFIGLGNMGGPMAKNLLKSGHTVYAFDLSPAALDEVVNAGGVAASSATQACEKAEVVISMLPAGEHVQSVYQGEGGLLAQLAEGVLVLDASTIDAGTAREVGSAAAETSFFLTITKY